MPRGIPMQAVFGKILLKHAVLIDHGAEIVEIDVTIGSAIALQPLIELQDLLRGAEWELASQ